MTSRDRKRPFGREELNERAQDFDTILEGHLDHAPPDDVVGTGDRARTQAELAEVWDRISGRKRDRRGDEQ